jgi:phosphate transport system substrate-binding protein
MKMRQRWIGILLCVAMVDAALGAGAVVRGAGATFPYPLYARWAAAYQAATGIEVGYEPVGSGAGVARFEQGAVDFGATDVPLSEAELQRIQAVQFPTVFGGVMPIVNLVGIGPGQLRLSGEVLADIYLGRITKWNASAIVSLNPGLSLPSSRITVVHRSDDSGTTHLWSDFLSRSSPAWRQQVGAGGMLGWPTGVGAQGNEGVAVAVQRTRASIGYVAYAYASPHHLAGVSVRNHDGAFVQADRAAFEAAVQQARWHEPPDLTRSLIDLPGAATWPMVSASFVVLPAHSERAVTAMKFFDWALIQGQPVATELNYVPLPEEAIGLVRRAWADRTDGTRAAPR